MICHCKARANLPSKLLIFDIVYLGRNGRVRSAFKIERTRGRGAKRIFYFKKFVFAPSKEHYYVLFHKIIHPPMGSKLSETKVEDLLSKLKKAGYLEYNSGEIPKNINLDDWDAMKMQARHELGRRHYCP